jgi:nucleoid DNA-binding protein
MTKADIVSSVATATGITKTETEAVIDGFIITIMNALKNGQNVDLRGFANFTVKKRKSKIARNPKTGETIELKERYVPTIKISKQFKNSVSENMKNDIVESTPQ